MIELVVEFLLLGSDTCKYLEVLWIHLVSFTFFVQLHPFSSFYLKLTTVPKCHDNALLIPKITYEFLMD